MLEAGKIVTSNAIIKNNLLDEFTKLLEKHTVLEAEKLLFGSNNYEVSAMLFEKWGFDKSFINLITAAINPTVKDEKILHIVYTLIGTDGTITDKIFQKALNIIQEYEFDIDVFENAIDSIKKNL